ncbi:MAG: ATP-binding protein [Gemmatimonadales bacterium]|jgi:signal transduction histidine kinase
MTERVTKIGGTEDEQDRLISQRRYRKMVVIAAASVSAVAVAPLLVMSAITYHQYQEVIRAELTRPMFRFVAAGKMSMESFLSERLSALAMASRENSFDELRQAGKLTSLLANFNHTFGGVIDLGLIDERGSLVGYAGPDGLQAVSYANDQWFREVSARGVYVSDVFLGYRNFPHSVIAVQHHEAAGRPYVIRATIDTDAFHWLVRARTARSPEQDPVCRRCHSLGLLPFSDAFILNREGVLQTSSQLYGEPLESTPLPPLPPSSEPTLLEVEDEDGEQVVVCYAQIERSPFTLVALSPRIALHAGWLPLRRDLLAFPAISITLILAVVVWGSVYVVKRLRETDAKRAALYHKMEYTNKMAAIGRLGAGVAHEINNPLSIITQNAGLLRDLITLHDGLPPKDKMIQLVDAVSNAADRCGGITHRLLGFARHMEVQWETIDLDVLLKEVLEFLGKEASYRDVQIEFKYSETPPRIVSDRGQLQQVFLNIINNAFAAVEDGGRIEIGIEPVGDEAVAVRIADDGVGIPEEHLSHIFDPFFTTKKGAGTGLGLSITYGIVQKLGGQVAVESEVGEGTCFTITLPIRRRNA